MNRCKRTARMREIRRAAGRQGVNDSGFTKWIMQVFAPFVQQARGRGDMTGSKVRRIAREV